jgi:hypothetical protein
VNCCSRINVRSALQLGSDRDITDIGPLCYVSYSLWESGDEIIWNVSCVTRRCSYLAC